MTDKVQKIKEWISKTKDGLMDAQGYFGFPEHEGAFHILSNLDYYIDSLQEEPRFKVGQTIADPTDSTFTFHINKIENGKYIESDDAWVLIKDADEEYQLVEEPVSEDLEEEVIKKVLYFSENFHKAPWTIDSTGAVMPIWYAKFGANWQKQKMMKDAVEAAVNTYEEIGGKGYVEFVTNVPVSQYKGEHGVKIIIIKED